ncbi:MAG: site-specific tyrosine recombinase/integron integrase [Candidatus Nanoarchaeia archaeon]
MSYYPIDMEKSVKKECKRRRLSPRTFKTYLYCINRFLKFTKKDLGKISKKDVRLFLEYLSDREMSGNTMNTYHMAIRFLFENVLKKRMWIDIKYSKVPEKLPEVLSKEEVRRLIDSIKNTKHVLMISLMYSSGLRVSELISLRVRDLELNKKYGYVRNGKGGKDRLIVIPKNLINPIKRLMEKEDLDEENYLFNSNRNKKYSIRSIQKIIEKASKISGIKRKIHPHTLRHSFATHLIENGYDVSQVQTLLGHKSPETTLIYTHIASPNLIKTKSPLESL